MGEFGGGREINFPSFVILEMILNDRSFGLMIN